MNIKLPVIGNYQHGLAYITDGQLQEAPTVRNLLRFLEPATTRSSCGQLIDRFLQRADIYALPVIDPSGKPVALIDRKYFIEFFSKPYSREIFGPRTIEELLAYESYSGNDCVIVEDSCSIEDVAQIIIKAGMQHMATGFIVTHQERYLGVANGHDLLNVITQRKQAELFYLAHYDNLTGLPNRMLFGDRLAQACREAERKGERVALLFVDIDRFKQINDSLGHRFGDAVLCEVAKRIKASARRADTVARLGGDEFVVLMEDIGSFERVEIVAHRMLDAMRKPIELLGHSLVVTVSVGSAIFPDDDSDLSPLLAKADAAMYAAKTGGRNGFRKYSPDTALYDPASKILENELRQAIERNELILHFQPQVNLASGQLCGVEALVRWRHPERGMISPGQFIPIAEESGLIVPLGEWVLCQALREYRVWQRQGLPPLQLSINISALQFRQPGFPDLLGQCLDEHGVAPSLVELELTESLLMHNVTEVLHTLERIKALGVRLAVDDFGTGFSSLSYLSRYPIDRLKIDQTFVHDIERSPANESIVRAILALASSLSQEVVAEGIETEMECAILKRMHCTVGQGYLFGKPMPAADIVRWHQTQGSSRTSFAQKELPLLQGTVQAA